MNSVQEDLARIETALAVRWPESVLEPSTHRIAELVDLLGRPQDGFPVIHLTGTNGKTSTARMVDSVLRSFGLRTGRYTSPHLDDVRERISLEGRPIDAERFVAAFDELAPYVHLVDAGNPDTPMSYFEVLTGLAFAVFVDAPVDVAVVEVGMGGRWDATNVADARVAVVTPIALDHQAYLGDDVVDIAAEKAGIIKPGSVAVLAMQGPEIASVLFDRAAEVGATVVQEGVAFGVRHREIAVGGQVLAIQGLGGLYEDVFLPLHGAHQAQNAACALAAVESFLGGGQDLLDPEAVRAGFAAATSPGRLEVVRRGPTVLLDAAHNPHGAQALAAALDEAFSFGWLVGVIAVLSDKDARGLLEPLEPLLTHVVVTANSSPRSLPVEELAEVAREVFGEDRVQVRARLDDALDLAVGLAEESGDSRMVSGGGVIVTGSVVTVGDARRLMRGSG